MLVAAMTAFTFTSCEDVPEAYEIMVAATAAMVVQQLKFRHCIQRHLTTIQPHLSLKM